MSTSSGTSGADDQSRRVVEELRLLLDALLGSSMNDVQARAQRWNTQSDPEQHVPTTCGWCPLCAAIAVVRGQRPELAVRVAERVAGLLHVLRDMVEHHDAPHHRDHDGQDNSCDHNCRDHNGADHDGHDGHGVAEHRGDGHSSAAAPKESAGGSGSERAAAEELMRVPSRVQRINLRRTEGCSSGPSLGTEGCSSGPSQGTEGWSSGPSQGTEGWSSDEPDAGGGSPCADRRR